MYLTYCLPKRLCNRIKLTGRYIAIRYAKVEIAEAKGPCFSFRALRVSIVIVSYSIEHQVSTRTTYLSIEDNFL